MIIYAWVCIGCGASYLLPEKAHLSNMAEYNRYKQDEAIYGYRPMCAHEVECSAKTGLKSQLRPFAQWSAEAIQP